MMLQTKLGGNACRFLALMFVFILIPLFSACDGGSDLPDFDSDDFSDTTEAPETDAETEYTPTMDPDANTLEGIAIKSAEDLAKIGVDPDYPLNGDYVLVIDIDLSDYESWAPIGTTGLSGVYDGNGVFTGTFDGRNHIISGLKIEENAQYDSFWGLFGTVGSGKKKSPAVIKNIVLKNVSVTLSSTAATAVGALAGQVNGYAEISGISLLSGEVSFSGSGSLGIGAVIGQCRTQKTTKISNEGITVENIFNNVTVTGENGAWNNCA